MASIIAMSEESDMAKNNPELVKLLTELRIQAKKKNAPIWRDIAERLERPLRVWPEVNVSRIERYANEGDVILVPGKVLGSGVITKKVTVAAWKFSKGAKEKIESIGGKTMTIKELMKKNPTGSNVRIMG
ncbi:ribosomal protein L18E [Aciduliprofundum sp. MAR08-339]|nr:ribosomal protein L18E [Aciduliprofundum sp. MAR08-339]